MIKLLNVKHQMSKKNKRTNIIDITIKMAFLYLARILDNIIYYILCSDSKFCSIDFFTGPDNYRTISVKKIDYLQIRCMNFCDFINRMPLILCDRKQSVKIKRILLIFLYWKFSLMIHVIRFSSSMHRCFSS